jgi:Uma2 family endonuclease
MYMATKAAQSPRKPRPFRWTRAHLTRLPDDGNRYEVLDGALLVTPQAGPPHQVIAARLTIEFGNYFEAAGRGLVVGPGAVVFEGNELQPDVLLIPVLDRNTTAARWEDFPLPMLVIEVLSPGSHRHDLVKKRDAYLRIGIPEYWVVDPDERCVLVFRPEPDSHAPTRVTDSRRWQPWADVPPLEIGVKKLFPG